MQKIKFSLKRRLAEIACVVFGHSWDTYEEARSEECDYPLEQSNTCSTCGLVNRDVSGYIRLYESKHAPNTACTGREATDALESKIIKASRQ